MTRSRLLPIVVALLAGVACSVNVGEAAPPTTTTTAPPKPVECYMSLDELRALQAEAGSYGMDTLTRELDRQAYIRGHLCD